MSEQSSRKFLEGPFAILLLLSLPFVIIASSSSSIAAYGATTTAASSAGIMVPLYIYPGSGWDIIADTKKAHPNMPLAAIVNPSSGPGHSKDSNYVSGISKLKSAGVMVLGYVSTAYTNRDLAEVKSDIDKYKSWYPDINGIFFDEQTNWSGPESYYKQASDYARSKGFTFTVGNPGANSLPSYLDTVDVVLIYESPGLPKLSNYQSWASYENAKLGMIPFGVDPLPRQWVKDASQLVGWIYVTNDVLPNPWDSLPYYFKDLATLLDSGGSSSPPPPSSTPKYTLKISSVDQNGNAINGMWMEISKNGAIVNTGYTPLSVTLEQGTYTVAAANYKQIIFDHWSDGTKSNTITVNLTTNVEITAHYNNGEAEGGNPAPAPKEYKLTVNTADSVTGNAIHGYYTTLWQNGQKIAEAFSPASFTVNGGQTYQVIVADYGSRVFDHWEDGSKTRERTITPTQSMTLTAYYNSTEVALTIKSVDLSGNTINGMWTVIKKNGNVVKTGYTPLTHTAQSGSTYEVSVANYKNIIFDHWEDGSKSSTRIVTPTKNMMLTAYYRR